NSKLTEILGKLSVSNDTTEIKIRDALKALIDDFFRISSTVTIGEFKITEATIETEGSLKLAITAGYRGSSTQADVVITIPKITLLDRGWTLDEAGNLVIGSQAGMDDWTLNGRAEGKYTAVKRVLIQGDVTGIPDSAFSGCGDLEAIVIPDTVTSIGSQAFMHASLSEITLPPNLQSIGDRAFSDCSSLEKVVLQGTTPPSIGTSAFDQCKFVTDSTKGIVVPSGSSDAYRASWGDTLGESILEKHIHSFGTDLNSDELNHWNECICGAKGNVASHAWSDGVVVIPPTAAEAGMMGYVCPECQATRMEPIPATGGSPSVSGGNNSSVSGNGNPSVSGNGNPGSNPTVSGNDNPNDGGSGEGTSVPGNGNSGDGISVPGNGGSGDGTSDPESSNSGDGSLVYSGSMQQPDNSNELALFWSAFNAKTQKDTEPKTADGVPLELYATVTMIAGFFYLLLLFLDKYDIAEEKRRESLARLVRWAKCGGWLRKLPVMAVLLLMRTYYHIVDGQGPKV
ncbi:MAG: leucine-rich repeat protein, partial [Acetatifactor sp.]|nr:leucine-rich repeat protein [Acetatifactor sp.]